MARTVEPGNVRADFDDRAQMLCMRELMFPVVWEVNVVYITRNLTRINVDITTVKPLC
jgi:hypothetical protein